MTGLFLRQPYPNLASFGQTSGWWILRAITRLHRYREERPKGCMEYAVRFQRVSHQSVDHQDDGRQSIPFRAAWPGYVVLWEQPTEGKI